MLNWWWKRRRRINERRAQAEAELRRSAELLAETREQIQPTRQAYERNGFSDIVRNALGLGWDARGAGGRGSAGLHGR